MISIKFDPAWLVLIGLALVTTITHYFGSGIGLISIGIFCLALDFILVEI